MDFDEVVKRRKMIREYDLNRQQIPDKIITKLIRNAHRAPSAGHTQVQEFILVKDASTKKKLRKASCKPGICRTSSSVDCCMF
jgi:nitroreductase